MVVASAASRAPCNHPCGTAPTCIGARSGSPVSPSCPPAASSVRSVANHLLLGPVAPKGERLTVNRDGLSALNFSRSSSSKAPQSRTTSAVAARRSISSTPPMTDFLPRFHAQCVKDFSPSSSSWANGPTCREWVPPSGSIATTSAPN